MAAFAPFVVVTSGPTPNTVPASFSDTNSQMVVPFQTGLQATQGSIIVTSQTLTAADPATGLLVPLSRFWVVTAPSVILTTQPVLYQSTDGLHFSLGCST